MSKHNSVHWLAQERIDIPDLKSANGFKPRSYEEILGDMVASFHAHTGEQMNTRPGSMIYTLFSIMAGQLVTIQETMQMSVGDIQARVNPDPMRDAMDVSMNVRMNQSIDFLPISIHLGNMDELKCECGSEKTGSNKHSTWCKKFSPDT